MPARGHGTAPKFEGNNPRELRRYFEELDYHFKAASITDTAEKKRFAVRYVDIDTEDSWKLLPAYTDISISYEDFRTAIFKLYPGADEERKWTISDLDFLTGERTRLGIRNKEDLGDYHRKFLAITGFLVSKLRMSENEVKRAFVRGFPVELWSRILSRLQMRNPNNHPDDPWAVQDVYDAAEFILHGSTSTYAMNVSSPYPSSSTTPQPPTTSDGALKKEELLQIIEAFSQSIAKAIAPARQSNASTSAKKGKCFYCEGDHFHKECALLQEHIDKGICKKNDEGKVVLPNGSYVARAVAGNNMAERILTWHRENGTSSSAMFFGISADQPQSSQSAYILQHSNNNRIQELEREIYLLRSRKVMEAVEIPRRTRQQDKAPESTPSQPPPPVASTSQKPSSASNPPPTVAKAAEPTHPFAAIPENSYVPPHERNFAAKPQAKDFAYRTTAPIQSPGIVNDVFNKTMKARYVTLSPEEIMSIAPDVRSKVRELITPRRTVPKPAEATYNAIEDDELLNIEYPTAPTSAHIEEVVEAPMSPDLPSNDVQPPEGSFIVSDPLEQYLQSLAPDEIPKQLVVAKDSHSLRSVHMRVNFRDTLECVLDNGCQIVSMSEAAAFHLHISYDPTIYLNMESANGTLNRTLGLARNVHCKIGNINLYFQIHIIRNPAYDILLGRPFDVLTGSTIHNYTDGNQTITINCPNSKYTSTIPTFPRSRPRFITAKPPPKLAVVEDDVDEQQGFRNSMN
jgi:hypothetical protein